MEWKCEFCGRSNPEDVYSCPGCGAGKVERKATRPVERNKKEKNREMLKLKDRYTQKSYLATLSAMVVGTCLIVNALMNTLDAVKAEEIRVEDHLWETEIVYQKLIQKEGSGFELPEGAVLLYETEEIVDYDNVITGTKSVPVQKMRETEQGTEFYVETVEEPVYSVTPVYKTKYHYRQEEWYIMPFIKNKGTGLLPAYGRVNFDDNEKVLSRETRYYLLLSDYEEPVEVGKETFYSLEDGDIVTIGNGEDKEGFPMIEEKIQVGK